MTKQEKIQEAYGNGSTWNILKNNTDTDGWCRNEAFAPNTDLLDLLDLDNIERFVKSDIQGNLIFRPKSLQGIENNNGWISLKENGLLNDDAYYFVNIDNNISIKQFHIIQYKWWEKYVTHYQTITKPQPPIY